MRVIVRSPAEKAGPGEIRLLTPETSRLDDLSSNVVALLASATQAQSWTGYHPVFKAIWQPRWDPRKPMAASLFCHAAAALLVLNVAAFWRFAQNPNEPDRSQLSKQHIEWY